ncbi:MAG: ATP-dependent metallopeptidase FtsH/Yme1/Tma family protein [Chloroflexi bacterium]|nr:ATP-dependent metallopeptidase FtsH/Yme1/Tma family protein [Chloroflexota bacterium]
MIVAFLFVLLWALFTGGTRSGQKEPGLALNELAEQIKNGQVEQLIVDEHRVIVKYRDGEDKVLPLPNASDTFLDALEKLGVTPEDLNAQRVRIEFVPRRVWPELISLFGTIILPLFLIGGLVWFFVRQSQAGGNAAMAFGKSRARLIQGKRPDVTFNDVAGADEAKQELMEVVEFLKEPQKFIEVGARIPKGVLLIGPPGVGKTLLAKAVAGEAGVPFFSISGSEFVEMFVGVGASRVRDLFQQARKYAPSIVFVDEIDAVGRHRGAGLGGSHDEREQTLNQLLVEMDGFDSTTGIIVMAATNRPDILDPALLRPGRFDRRIVVDRPDLKGRLEILKVHTRGKPLAPDVDLEAIARATPGFVGADLENLVNEAAILAVRRGKKVIGQRELEDAIERVVLGPERKSRVIDEAERRILAYHEAGHAVVMQALPEADPVHKITIIPRGMAGGYTMSFPTRDRLLASRKKLFADMVGLLGGRAAEELVFDDITTGAANDLEQVTRLARTMVMRFGMSDELGPMTFGRSEELVFLGREIAEQRDYSEAVAEKIDREVQRLVRSAYEKAKSILQQYRDVLDRVAEKLLEKETLTREEFEAIFPPPHKKDGSTPRPAAA